MNVLVPILLLALIAVGQGQAPKDGDLLDEPCILPQNAMLEPTRFVDNTTGILNVTRGFQRNFRGTPRQIRTGARATKIDTSKWGVEPNKKWADLCPEKVTFITPPRWHVYMRQICYVPAPFTAYKYPTIVCARKTCRYASGARLYCRPDVPTIYTIPTYCYRPRQGKFVRRSFKIYTYRYCTCCHYKCPQFPLTLQ